MPSIFRRSRQALRVIGGAGVIQYHVVVTREIPFWNLTLTGGDLPKSGHVMTSTSYARLPDDLDDWLSWHQYGEVHNYVLHNPSNDAEDDDTDGQGGEGYSIAFDCRWPKTVKDAQKRYWAAKGDGAGACAGVTPPGSPKPCDLNRVRRSA